MKKLLTVSVFAIMAVSAANANIASTEYVYKQTGADESGVFVAGSFTGVADTATNLKDAVNAIAGAVGSENVSAQIGKAIEEAEIAQSQVTDLTAALEGKADDATTLAGYGITDAYTKTEVDTQISNSISDFDSGLKSIKDTVTALPTTYAPINTVEEAEQTAINTAAEAITETIGSGFTKESTVASQLGAVKTTADNAAKSIGEMDLATVGGDGKYIKSVTQADGKVTATYADLTDVAKMEVPDVCNGTATCALVWNKNTQKLDWEAIMQ